jgi:hypothetical protein
MNLELASVDQVPEQEQKRLALGSVRDAWNECVMQGVDGDCLAQTCLFMALAELVETYGEDAAAVFTDRLSARIQNGEFSMQVRQ